MHVSPILAAQATYPFVRIERAKREAAEAGIEIIDFGQGDPREPTDPAIRQALVDGLRERMGYPKAEGLPELREAIAGWAGRRFGVELDPDREVIPTLGSKEAIFSFAHAMLDADGTKDAVVVTEPGYPVYERGALFARAHAGSCRCARRTASCPTSTRSTTRPGIGSRSSGSTTRTTRPARSHRSRSTSGWPMLAAEHDFLIASDEAYSELWFDEPPPSALQVADRTNVVVFNTLSKRSSMTGYRSGFVAGPPEVIAALRRLPADRRHRAAGVRPARLDRRLGRRGPRRARARRLRAQAGDHARRPRPPGWRLAEGSRATMYLWLEVPGGGSSEACADRLLEHGIVVAPGAYLGEAGEGYVRLALVPTEEECRKAASILETVL